MSIKTAAILLGLALAMPAQGQPLPQGPKRFTGAWSMGHDGEGARTCVINLDPQGVIGGARLRVPARCKGIVDRWDELYAWYVNPDGQLVMADATRKSIYRFRRLDPGLWASEGGDFERYLIYYRPAKKR